jgi:hypothetical protein
MWNDISVTYPIRGVKEQSVNDFVRTTHIGIQNSAFSVKKTPFLESDALQLSIIRYWTGDKEISETNEKLLKRPRTPSP